jgi:glutathione peroxidase-family protein
LVRLDEKYRERGLRILGFPCNQFGSQEPGTHEEIKEFTSKLGVQFPLFAKINVNGIEAHPLFVFLKKELHGFLTNDIKWNFTKFVMDRNGKPIQRFAPKEEPFSMEPLILRLLDQE